MSNHKPPATVRLTRAQAERVAHWANVLDVTPARFLALAVERWDTDPLNLDAGNDNAPNDPRS